MVLISETHLLSQLRYHKLVGIIEAKIFAVLKQSLHEFSASLNGNCLSQSKHISDTKEQGFNLPWITFHLFKFSVMKITGRGGDCESDVALEHLSTVEILLVFQNVALHQSLLATYCALRVSDHCLL